MLHHVQLKAFHHFKTNNSKTTPNGPSILGDFGNGSPGSGGFEGIISGASGGNTSGGPDGMSGPDNEDIEGRGMSSPGGNAMGGLEKLDTGSGNTSGELALFCGGFESNYRKFGIRGDFGGTEGIEGEKGCCCSDAGGNFSEVLPGKSIGLWASICDVEQVAEDFLEQLDHQKARNKLN
ncbi:unnamed protein product [Camellia sinensis]